MVSEYEYWVNGVCVCFSYSEDGVTDVAVDIAKLLGRRDWEVVQW